MSNNHAALWLVVGELEIGRHNEGVESDRESEQGKNWSLIKTLGFIFAFLLLEIILFLSSPFKRINPISQTI